MEWPWESGARRRVKASFQENEEAIFSYEYRIPFLSRRSSRLQQTRNTDLLSFPKHTHPTPPSTMATTISPAGAPAATSAASAVEECEAAILTYLSTNDNNNNDEDAIIEDTYPWSMEHNLNHVHVVGAIKSLLADAYVHVEDLSTQFWTLEDEGQSVLQVGSQESRVFQALRDAPERGRMTLSELQQHFASEPDVVKIGMGNCMKLRWIRKDPSDGSLRTVVDSVEDQVQKQLLELQRKDFHLQALDDKVRGGSVSERSWDAHAEPFKEFLNSSRSMAQDISHDCCLCYER
jgi:PheRS DNA binding domain 3/PheRS DNA binding domain 1